VSLAVIIGCSPAPATAQPQAPIVVAPTDTPEVLQTDTPVVVPTLAPTNIPTAEPTAAPPPQAAANGAVSDAMNASSQSTDLASCDDTARPDPIPPPGSPRRQGFFSSFHIPLPRAPLFDPPGPKRVGLQAGHWLVNEVPPELTGLQAGAVGGGKEEWQVNLDVAQRTAALLEADGIETDVMPATVPEHYQANAFLAIHADGDTTGQTRGFKVARPGFSSIPDVDDRFVDTIDQTYGGETGLPRDDEHVSLRMKYYYAFNSRRYCHAVAPGVPQAIIEMAYLTNATDRAYLIGDPQELAQAIADSIQNFLATTP
jgi:N-acetylmuramoyl-L-alanine amidase